VAFTFGGTTAHNINFASAVTFGATARTSLVCAWYYPTTLTATRRLFAAGATWGAEVDTTTDELRLRTDNTTDGQWTTTGVDMAVNEWKFIAIMNSTLNTGPASAWRVWVGTAESAPVAATVSVATSPVGNFTGNGTFYIGNTSGAALSWQGDIENMTVVATSATIGVTTHPFAQVAYGAITAAEEQVAYERFVGPAWLGQDFPFSGQFASTAMYWAPLFNPGTGSSVAIRSRNYTSAADVAVGIGFGGGAASNNAGPRQGMLTTILPGSPQTVRR
jgi:hypothetical protein